MWKGTTVNNQGVRIYHVAASQPGGKTHPLLPNKSSSSLSSLYRGLCLPKQFAELAPPAVVQPESLLAPPGPGSPPPSSLTVCCSSSGIPGSCRPQAALEAGDWGGPPPGPGDKQGVDEVLGVEAAAR